MLQLQLRQRLAVSVYCAVAAQPALAPPQKPLPVQLPLCSSGLDAEAVRSLLQLRRQPVKTLFPFVVPRVHQSIDREKPYGSLRQHLQELDQKQLCWQQLLSAE